MPKRRTPSVKPTNKFQRQVYPATVVKRGKEWFISFDRFPYDGVVTTKDPKAVEQLAIDWTAERLKARPDSFKVTLKYRYQ